MVVRSQAHVALGRAIRRRRADRALTQERLAERSGLHRTYVGGIERGERNPSFTNLVRVADALGVKPSELLADAERLSSPPPPSRRLGAPGP